MADDPVSEIIDENPTPGVIFTLPGGSKDYDPNAEDVPGASASSPLVGFYSGSRDSGADFKASFLIKAADRPAHLQEGVSKARINNSVYGIAHVRERVWEGVINGYTLELV